MKEGIKVSADQAAKIEEQTQQQSKSKKNKWQSERESRLTASNFGAIMTLTDRRDIENFCKSMHTQQNLSHIPAIKHGQIYEAAALEKFAEVTGKRVLKSGFCIDPQYPFLGASPDAFVEGEDAVIEIKCPYNGRNSQISADTLKHFSFLEEVDNTLRLKRNNKYFYQIVGQMKLSKRSYGYFVVYTFKDLHYEKITLDEDFFMNTMLPKLREFYDNEYCPYITSLLKKFDTKCECPKEGKP